METREGILLVIAATLFLIEVGLTVWAYRVHQALRGGPGSKLTRINIGVNIGVTLGQAVLFCTFLFLNVFSNDEYPPRALAVIVAQAITTVTMLWAISNIKRIK